MENIQKTKFNEIDPSTSDNAEIQIGDIQNHSFIQKITYIIKLALVSAIGGFLFGYDTGVIGGVNLYININGKEPSYGQKETFTSIAIIGAAVGSLIIGPISDKYGRKISIIISDIIFIIGTIILYFGQNMGILYFGRFVLGLGIGIASMVVPIYLSESSPKKIRGALVTINVCFITGGQFLAYFICLGLEPKWRAMLGVAGIPPLLQLILMVFIMNESPRWLLKKGNFQKADKLFKRTYKMNLNAARKEKETEMQEIILLESIQKKHSTKANFKEMFLIYRKIAFVGLMLQVCQQFSGINTVMYYGPQMMQEAGWVKNNVSPEQSHKYTLIASIPLALINFLGTIVAIFFIDKLGRRYIMLRVLPGCALGMLMLGFSIMFQPYSQSSQQTQVNNNITKYTAGIAIIIYIVFFSVGMGPTPWTVNSEIYPIHLRGMGNSISTFFNWIPNYIISAIFLSAISGKTLETISYFVLALFCMGSFVFIYYMLPETKGKSTIEIIKLFLPNLELKQIDEIQNEQKIEQNDFNAVQEINNEDDFQYNNN